MVTIYDIAKKANVSAMTVSRVINNTGRISEKTRLKVQKVMEELHYVPNATARSLVLQRTMTLSLLITDITNPFYTTVARGAEDAARENGYKLLLGNSDESVDKEREYIDTVLSTRVDGVLITPSGDRSRPHLETLARHGIPFVILDREVPGIACDCVLGDSVGGARKLVDYLIGLGHRRIALVNGSPEVSTARDRLAGYRQALAERGIGFDPAYVMESNYRPQDAEAAAERLLSLSPSPTAVFAANNLLALSLLQSLRKRGIGVPEELSIVTFDDFGYMSVLDPFFTLVAQPAYEFGRQGISLLIERIENRDAPPRRIVLPNELTTGRSVRPAAPSA
ncbi:LacI family DNA-binding transcriptional regulator [Paenibacillus cisolokensis]|uniref:LacI family DNA-binding transcriptional regulator n=1 Tax=Paenibacillus TaxID=44249 RepID=UPI0007819350|nr:LacI family DNA-binding transcriptional regulator [Paenibacillus sp. 32O-W]